MLIFQECFYQIILNADEVTALSELIKNSYDADATICSLVISSDYIEEINTIYIEFVEQILKDVVNEKKMVLSVVRS